MTSVLGRSLARIAERSGGQFMLEVPDDLPTEFVCQLVDGANSEVQKAPLFALFVHEHRSDMPIGPAHVDFRELAMYRQGAHLAFAFASENRGMSTYSSVYPLLLSSGFPSESAATGVTGVAGLSQLADAIATILAEAHGTFGLSTQDFANAVCGVLRFLADAYSVVGNGQSSFAADWWIHVDLWIRTVSIDEEESSGATGIGRIYGAAGLPYPEAGTLLSMSPSSYVGVLQSRWTNPPAIAAEIGRLQGRESASDAATALALLKWEECYSQTGLRSDSLVALVATTHGEHAADAMTAWSKLCEADFEKSFFDAKGKLAIRRADADLPAAWKHALPVLLARNDESPAEETEQFVLSEIELIVPYRPDRTINDDAYSAETVAGSLLVGGARGCECSFDVDGARSWADIDGFHVVGALKVLPSKKARNLAWLEVRGTGPAAQLLVDRCDGAFTLLRPDELALWARPQGKEKKDAQIGPVIWSPTHEGPADFELHQLGAHEFAIALGTARQLPASAASIAETGFSLNWPGMDEGGAKAIFEVPEMASVVVGEAAAFHLQILRNEKSPLSPIVAAAHGLTPDLGMLLQDDDLGYFEAQLLKCLEGVDPGCALGSVLVTSSPTKVVLTPVAGGVLCAPELAHRAASELSPGLPSAQLLNSRPYLELVDCYKALNLPKAIADAELAEGTAGLTVSRITVDWIDEAQIRALLVKYRSLLEQSAGLSSTDRFWARNPFSIAVYSDGPGFQAPVAVLLSPLHPIRFAWLWSIELGLREACDDAMSPAASLALLDGTQFPSSVLASNVFGDELPLVPITVDARPADLYLGWHVSVRTENGKIAVPKWMAGRRFPADGLSALSSASVSAAVDDFLRVSPHVQHLQIELVSISANRRSSSIDEGVLSKIERLAVGSAGLDGVSGVRVYDSDSRLGPIPTFIELEDAFALARPGFNAEWRNAPAGGVAHSHVAFLEGCAALIQMERCEDEPNGWVPAPPLRRTPQRKRGTNFTTLDYGISTNAANVGEFEKALAAYESTGGARHRVKLIPNPVGVEGKPRWLIASDFGADPQAISRAAKSQSGTEYILWDWRPATTVKADQNVSSRAQPYFVLAAIPPSLSTAIRVRLKMLNQQADKPEIDRRAKVLIETLAERAIGLNTLLAIGHHQATGALGFYFALRSIGIWTKASSSDESRLVIPVDAVDPFLRASFTSSGDGSRKRADLLLLRASQLGTGRSRIVLVPVEIKHYGLGAEEDSASFPLAGDRILDEHVAQLESYQEQLKELCEGYRSAVGSQASLLGQRLGAVVDAAVQLHEAEVPSARRLLSDLASGRADIEVGKGVLLWYQAGATGLDGQKAHWEEIGEVAQAARIEVRIDPAAYDAEYWNMATGSASKAVCDALDCAVQSTIDYPPNEPVTDDKNGVHRGVDLNSTQSAEVQNAAIPTNVTDPEAAATQAAKAHVEGVKIGDGESKGTVRRQKLSPSDLEKRYSTILAALKEFSVKVERPKETHPYREGPAFVEYSVSPSYGVSVNRIESQLENLKLRLKLPSEAEIGCSTHMGNVVLTVPKLDAERYFVDAAYLWANWIRPKGGFKIPVGEDASGEIVEIDLSDSNSPHLLVAGVTGSGKSEALLTILHGATKFYGPQELRLRLIDPKQTELTSLADLPHTEGEIGWTGEEAVSLLEDCAKEMDSRYEKFRAAGAGVRSISEYQAKIGPLARWIVVLDEYADLVSDDNVRKQIEKNLQRLSQKARAAGIHVIVSTQKPVVQVVNTVVKGNLPGKIALRVNTAMESRVILDESGAELLVGKGDAIVRCGNARTRIQFARYAI